MEFFKSFFDDRQAGRKKTDFEKRKRAKGGKLLDFNKLEPRQLLAADVFINEFLTSNNSGTLDGNNNESDWIELYNAGTSEQDLAGWHLTDDAGVADKWTFPSGPDSIIAPGEYLIVFASSDGVQDPDGFLHANFSLSASGEYIGLTDTNLSVVSEFGLNGTDFPTQRADISYGVGANGNRFFETPTFAAANGTGLAGVVGDTAFSVDRGFFDAPFNVEITTPTAGATIYYTTNGSVPSTTNGQVYSSPVTITGTTNLRAAAFLADHIPTNVDTQTYIFTSDVLTQPADGGVTVDSDRNIDFQVDPDVALDPLYTERLLEGLQAIPTVSLTSNVEDIFGNTGLYNNTQADGLEVPTSVEYILADGTTGFQIDAGLQIAGGASRIPSRSVKHSFSLRFRQEYGNGRLNYELFEDSLVDSFNTLQLRAGYNNSFVHSNVDQRDNATLIRDQFIRDSLLAMGQDDAGQGLYTHLYLNGLYWGVYNLHERADAAHYAEYQGGDADDYDSRNGNNFNGVESPTGTINNVSYQQLLNAAANGTWQEVQERLDVENFIDWTIIQQYNGNDDIAAHNNWRGAGGGDANGQWRFYAWDSERTLEDPDIVLPGTGTDASQILDDLINRFPQFVQQFEDRIQLHYFNGGALTEEALTERWNARMAELDLAIIGESARWGDARGTLYTRDNQWLAANQEVLTEFFPERAENVIEAYQALGLFSNIDAPTFLVNGATQSGGNITAGAAIGFEGVSVGDSSVVVFENTFDSGNSTQNGNFTEFAATGGTGGGLTGYNRQTSGNAGDNSAAGFTIADGDLTPVRTNHNDRGNVLSTNAFELNTFGEGFRFEFDYTIIAGLDSSNDPARPHVGLIASDFVSGGLGAQTNSTYVTTQVRSGEYEGISINLSDIDATSGLYYENSLLVNGDTTIGGPGASGSAFLEIAGDGLSYTYSIGTGSMVTGTLNSAFDFSKDYHFFYSAQDTEEYASLQSVALTNISSAIAGPTVYYTTDGSDPRSPDGSINPDANGNNTLPFTLNTTTNVHARTLTAGQWSPVHEATFVVAALQSELRISEINYNPAAPTAAETLAGFVDNDDFEFIEIFNPSTDGSINLNGVQLTDGVTFSFGDINLLPGERAVVVEDIDAFIERYGDSATVLGQWSGSLSNSGEEVTLLDSSMDEIMSVNYGDNGPWYNATDGFGFSLVLEDPVNTPLEQLGKYYSWRASTEFGGTPGANSATPLGVVINEVLAHTDLPQSDSIELFNPTSSAISVGEWYLSDEGDDLLKFQIPAGTVIAAGGYLVFDESDFNATASGFALSGAEGDQVYLSQAAAGALIGLQDSVEFGATFNGESLGRLPDGGGRLTRLASTSLGSVNGDAEVGPLVISEINYHPANPSTAALAIDATLTDNDLEYIEIANPTSAAIDLTDWRIRGEADFDFAAGTVLGVGQAIILVSFDPALETVKLAAFQAHYDISAAVTVVGGLSASLSNSTGRVALQQPDTPDSLGDIPHVVVDEVVYDDLAPFPDADGSGQSLERIDLEANGNLAASWISASPTPGAFEFESPFLLGDVNQDGLVNFLDISPFITLLSNGTFLDEADTNRDNRVDFLDISPFILLLSSQ